MTQFRARSISRPVWEQLGRADPTSPFGQVSAVFARSCHLALPDNELIALVQPELDDGPLNVVLGEHAGAFPPAGTPLEVNLDIMRLEIGSCQVTLDGAAVWEPRPDWEGLRAQATAIKSRLPHLATLALALAPGQSLASLFAQGSAAPESSRQVAHPDAGASWSESVASLASEAGRLLSLGWDGDGTQLRAAAVQLAGLGGGLTPSGDDFLVGVVMWAWVAHPMPERICQPLLEGAHLRTTALSNALLRAAAKGECSRPWHRLFKALQSCPDTELVAAVRNVLQYGHTSGADALAGLIWMGLHTRAI